MLQTKDLCKVYKPKKGVPVKAVNNVSLHFPDHGMVFLLGKSGSGKSTLLNLLGGLDRYDSGEIIIKGVSSRDFKQEHFDSYRNTYVGFIFQEYNVLEEFTVGANIALAIELQGRRATDEEINAILAQVDLTGYGSRKPNELSGGQKQRVAIARALVKNPEIIMADEPTGALDSATGRQVLETLKKLSADKLVLVVSHDREFAERYADRIVELADGRVVRDVEYLPEEQPSADTPTLIYSDSGITVPQNYRLTEEDRLAINAYLDARQNGSLSLSVTGGTARRATPTDVSRIAAKRGETFRLIKSRLPMKSAFKIGAGALKHKKIRLVITILLSCIAFGLFGLADTFGAYNHVRTCTTSLIDSGVSYVSVQKTYRHGTGEDAYYYNSGERIGDEELAAIEKETGVKMAGIYQPLNWNGDLQAHYNTAAKFTETDYHIYGSWVTGLSEVTEESLRAMGYTLMAGRLPDGTKDEIAISTYLCETFYIGGYTNDGGNTFGEIRSPADMLGKTLTLNGRDFTVTGVIDTRFDIERYRPLTKEKENMSAAEELAEYVLYRELYYAQEYSLGLVAMVGKGYLAEMMASEPTLKPLTNGWLYFHPEDSSDTSKWSGSLDAPYLGALSDVPAEEIVWLDGERTVLHEGEIVVSLDVLYLYDTQTGEGFTPDPDDPEELAGVIGSICPLDGYVQNTADGSNRQLSGYTIVGYMPHISRAMLAHDTLVSELANTEDGYYTYAVGPMPEGRGEVEDLVAYCYREDSAVRYQMQNPVTYQLDMVNETLHVLARIFLYIGLGFALFASLMLANFIATSIAYKKQEIGILRAIGSRSNDVFRIFFAESFVIAMINFVLSAVGTWVATTVINQVLRTETGLLITVLTFGVRQILLLFAVSLLVAAAASFLPVKRIASKRPIDAIRNR